MFRARAIRSSVLGACLLLLSSTALASTMAIDQALYGHLDQGLVPGCTSEAGLNNACGPTSVVNSFVYLQNRYPGIYGTLLTGGTTQQNLINTGENLACYMSCNSNTGTAIGDFITGKMDYINAVAPGTTTFAFQNFFDPVNSILPTFNFLFNELSHGEDIELLIGWYVFNAQSNQLERRGGHYVTLTGISSANNDGTGTINFVDPSGGVNQNNIATFLSGGAIRTIAYKPDGVTVAIIEAAVAESPVPESTTFVLVLGGAVPILLRLRRRR